MSFFEDASLVMIPSGYKASKVYSVKPTDGTGDLTFTRALDTATRVAENGLIERVRTNLILQSNSFNTTWGATSLTITSGAIAPDGTATAWTAAAAGGGAGIIQQAVTLTGLRSGSIFAKQGTHRYLYAGVYGGTTAYNTFDLQDGVVASGTTGRIESVGNGWYRCTMFGADGTTGGIQIFPTDTIGAPSTAGGNILIFGCQYESGDIATPYIPTTTAAVSVGMLANVPRLDYTGGGCPKLLLEPQRVNLITFSEQLNNAVWNKDNTTVTTGFVSPSGFANAFKLTEQATNAVHSVYQSFPSISSSVYTASVFVKKGERFKCSLADRNSGAFVAFNLNTGSILASNTFTGKIEAYANDWYRVTVTSASALTVIVPQIFVLPDSYTTGLPITLPYLGDGTSGIFVWGGQLEAGSYPTSYIPTLGAAVTRSADAASKTGISALIGQTEGTLFVEIAVLSGANDDRQISINDGTTSNRVTMALSSNGTQIQFVVQSGGSVVMNSTQTISGLTTGVKIAYAYKVNDFAVYVNGSLLATDTSGAVPISPSAFSFDAGDGGDIFFGKVNQTLLFKTRLTNAQLAELTA